MTDKLPTNPTPHNNYDRFIEEIADFVNRNKVTDRKSPKESKE